MRKRMAARVGDGGTLSIPAEFRRRHGLDPETTVIVEQRQDGIFLRPASAVSRHTYSNERRAQFLLANAADEEEYREAVEAVRAMGLDPEQISHVGRRESAAPAAARRPRSA